MKADHSYHVAQEKARERESLLSNKQRHEVTRKSGQATAENKNKHWCGPSQIEIAEE